MSKKPTLTFLARRLIALREAASWSRYKAAQMSGLTTQGYVDLETGAARTAKWDTVQRLAAAFGVTTDSLREPEA